MLELHTRGQLRAELVQVGAESSEQDLSEQIAHSTFRVVKLERVSLTLARLLYQELVMEGGQVVTPARLDHVGLDETNVLLCATRYQFEHLLVRLRWQENEELDLLADEIEKALNYFEASPSPSLTLGPRRLEWGKQTYVMGVLNVTPDSFSGDGLVGIDDREADWVARSLARAWEMVANGADVLDIGGESSHPQAVPVDADTELRRVLPVIRAVAQELDVAISVDTQKAQVARAALEAGAHLVNDVSGARGDPEMPRLVAAQGAALAIMHNALGTKMASGASDFMGAIIRQLRAQIESALDAGVAAERILIDPGVGFGLSTSQNLELLNRLREIKSLGFPILIGPSRKGFISRTLNVPDDEREEGTAAAIALGIAHGTDMVRVHDVKAMARVAKMADAVVRQK